MKKLYFSLIALSTAFFCHAQTSDSLVVVSAGNDFRAGHLLSDSKDFIVTDTFSGVGSMLNEVQTYDMLNERFYVGLDNYIARIDARNGRLQDTLATGILLTAIESDLGFGGLIGLGPGASGLNVYSINTQTRGVHKLTTISGITQTQGQSTMNFIHSRIYIKTNLGIACIDALTGNLLDTIFNPNDVSAIEFHPGTQLLYGVYTNGNNEKVFCSLNPSNKVYTDIGVLPYFNWHSHASTMDVMSSRYIIHTGLGITFIRLNDATITDTMALGNFVAFEYMNKLIIVNPGSVKKHGNASVLTAYPNPTGNVVNLAGIEPGNAYQVWNSRGQLVLEGLLEPNGIDLTGLSSGLYQLRFSNGSSVNVMRQP